MKVTLGGNRLGAGNKQEVELHGYDRSTHDLSYLWRSTMSVGTIVPFMVEVAKPGDTFDLELNANAMTHPTQGPLFGSLKVQCDTFLVPVRLYQALLHNNELGVGMKMATVKLPQLNLEATPYDPDLEDVDNQQINPSHLLSYLGIRGVGLNTDTGFNHVRQKNGIPYLAYWDIYKNYYANKQEENGVYIHTARQATVMSVTGINIFQPAPVGAVPVPQVPAAPDNITLLTGYIISIDDSGTQPLLNQILIRTDRGTFTAQQLMRDANYDPTNNNWQGVYNGYKGSLNVYDWDYKTNNQSVTEEISLNTFPLENIDKMRKYILTQVNNAAAVVVNGTGIGAPYEPPLNFVAGLSPMISTSRS